ncbi:MAG: preprotein translocase subunit SecA [Cytophagales bacterium]
MISFILGLFKRLFGTQAQRQLKALRREVLHINKLCEALQPLSHDELRDATGKLRAEIAAGVKDFNEKIAGLEEEVKAIFDLKKQYVLFQKIEQLKKQRNKRLRKILDRIMHRAFAIVKETARRFKENKEIIVTANDFDRSLAANKDYLSIAGEKAHWNTTWDVASQMIKWDMVHFDVQLLGGIVLHRGKIAEMATGEGKTLVATLPAFLNALSGEGVHIWTVNDYLAKRDAVWNAPIFEFHNISVGCIEGTPIQSEKRKQAYAADITYGTNNGFGFDYLYDNIAKHQTQQVQRPYNYVIIDEIDSAAIDEAGTPYIISGPTNSLSHKHYRALKPRIKNLYQQQQKLVIGFLREAKEKIAANQINAGGTALFQAYRGLPTYKPLISYLAEKGIKKILSNTEDNYLQENSKLMPEIDRKLFFTIDKKYGKIDLTDKGIEHLTQKTDGADFFVLPDLAGQVAAITKDTALTQEEKEEQQKEVTAAFFEKSERIHCTNNLLKAYTLYEKNKEYVVMNNEVKIVDQQTGRILGSRRFSDGLHQALEAKEGVKIKRATQTFASITASNLIRKYPWKAGMTGTAKEDEVELMDIYGLAVISIPPNKPNRRKDLPDRLYKTKQEKYQAIVQFVAEIQKTTGQPILLITPSVEVSQEFRKPLGISPQKVLNAKNHALEASIIADAGKLYAKIMSTQMGARGTDYKIEDAALAVGGLVVIIVEKNPIARLDSQSRGRTARQGQPGTTICFLSLDADYVLPFKQGPLGKQVDKTWNRKGEVIVDPIIDRIIESIRKDKQQNHFHSRKTVSEYDDVKELQRGVFFKRRNNILHLDRLAFETMQSCRNTLIDLIRGYEQDKALPPLTLSEILNTPKEDIQAILVHHPKAAFEELYTLLFQQYKATSEAFAHQIEAKIKESKPGMQWAVFPVQIGEITLPIEVNIEKTLQTQGKHAIQEIHKSMILSGMDLLWSMHLQHLDYLQEDVRNANYEQKSPLLIFKAEGLKMFQKCLKKIDLHIAKVILNHTINIDGVSFQDRATAEENTNDLEINKKDMVATETKPVVVENIFSRNDRVTVAYTDGTIKTAVKYKTVVKDIEEGKCKIITPEQEKVAV